MLCQSKAARRWEGEHVKGFHSNEYELLWIRARRCCSLKAAPTMTLCVTWLVEIHSSSVVSHACFIHRLRRWSIRFQSSEITHCIKEWAVLRSQQYSARTASLSVQTSPAHAHTHARTQYTHTRTYTHSHTEHFTMYCWDRTTAYSSFLNLHLGITAA